MVGSGVVSTGASVSSSTAGAVAGVALWEGAGVSTASGAPPQAVIKSAIHNTSTRRIFVFILFSSFAFFVNQVIYPIIMKLQHNS
jgi:hypothetical protein